jgi:hypothetical protein
MKTTFQRACEAKGRPWLTLAEVAALPITKADLAHDAAAFEEACERAEAKGNRAQDLLASAECNPDPALVTAWAKDFGGTNDRR